MLALVSNKYLSSAVCQEEYNLALAKHCSEVSTQVSFTDPDVFRMDPNFEGGWNLEGAGIGWVGGFPFPHSYTTVWALVEMGYFIKYKLTNKFLLFPSEELALLNRNAFMFQTILF